MARRRTGADAGPEELDYETQCPRCATVFDVPARAEEARCPGCRALLALVEPGEAPAAPSEAAEPPEPAAAAEPDPALARTLVADAPADNVPLAAVDEPPAVGDAGPVEEPEAAARKKWKDPVVTAKGIQEARRRSRGSAVGLFETPCPGCNTTLKVTEDARKGECPWCGMGLEFEDVVEEPVGEDVVAPSPEPSPPPAPLVAETRDELVPAAAAAGPEPVAAAPAPESPPPAPSIAITAATSPIVQVSPPPRAVEPLEEVVGVSEAQAAPPRAPVAIHGEPDELTAAPAPRPAAPTPPPAPAAPARAVAPAAAPSRSSPLEAQDELDAAAERASKRRFPVPALPRLGGRDSEIVTCPACRADVDVPRGARAFECPQCRQFLAVVDADASVPDRSFVPAFMRKAPPARRETARVEATEPVAARAAPAAPKPGPAKTPVGAPALPRVLETTEDLVAAAPSTPAARPAPPPPSAPVAAALPLALEAADDLVAQAPAPPAVRPPAEPIAAPPLPLALETTDDLVARPAPAAPKGPTTATPTGPLAASPVIEVGVVPARADEPDAGDVAPSPAPTKRRGLLGRLRPAPNPEAPPSAPEPSLAAGGEPAPAPKRFPLRKAEPAAPPAPALVAEVSEEVEPAAAPAPRMGRRRLSFFGRSRRLETEQEAEGTPEAGPAALAGPSAPAAANPTFLIEEERDEPLDPPAAVAPPPRAVPAPDPEPEPEPEPMPAASVPEPEPVAPLADPLPAAQPPAAPGEAPAMPEGRRGFFGRFRRRNREPDAPAAGPVSAAGPVEPVAEAPRPFAEIPLAAPEPAPVADPGPEAAPEPVPEVAPQPEPGAEESEPSDLAAGEPVAAPETEPDAASPPPVPLPEMPAASAPAPVLPDPFAPTEPLPTPEVALVPPAAGPTPIRARPLRPGDLRRRVDRVVLRHGRARRAAADVASVPVLRAPARTVRVAGGEPPDPGVIVKSAGPRLVEADFTLLPGVRAPVARRLRGAGYRTFGTLLRADAEKLALVVGVTAAQVRKWQRDADLGRLGLAEEEARWLRAVGVPTASRLRAAKPAPLARRVRAFARRNRLDASPDEETVARWVAAAKRVPAGARRAAG